MNNLSTGLQEEVEQILEGSEIEGSVTLQGSFARDTWISGDTDVDIFVRFPPTMERNEWKEMVLPEIRNGLKRFKVIERYAEHPFLEFYVNKIRINVVPCYDVKMGEWKSATDRTPYHTEFMNANLTDELRLEARLLKKFSRGICTYGAEIKIGGFSGMLIDTLALYYRSFVKAISEASSWSPKTRIEIGKPLTVLDKTSTEHDEELVVIDPVDPNRNLASAVRLEKLWGLVAAGRSFLRNPGTWYFFPPTPARRTRAQFARRITNTDRDLIAISFKHSFLVEDILWGQLLKLQRSLVDMLRRADIQVFRSGAWSDGKAQSAIVLEVDRETLSGTKVQRGPPVAKQQDSQSFLERHLSARDTIRGPWVEEDRWVVEKKRRQTSINDIVQASLKDSSYGLALPKRIGESIPSTVKVLSGKSTLSLLSKDGFATFLWDFLEAKPQWLRSVQS